MRIAAGSNVMVHLQSAPVVARMITGTAILHDDVERRLARDEWLRSKLDALTPVVFESSLPAQALHGDASTSNLLRTRSGLVWNDLEDVCTGPVAWDVCGLVTSAGARVQSAT